MAKKAKYTAAEQSRRVEEILRGLADDYPDARIALLYENPLELLVATILSAQCTDERVNIVTRDLFRKYRSAEDYANVRREGLENDIRSTGFFRNKAKSIQGACRLLLEKYGGRVPDTMEELLELPGVARKTANVVLGAAYGKAEGIVVDTHVRRVAQRLELTREADPEKIERDLMKLIPRSRWIAFSHQMILHGRRICGARKPLCAQCSLERICRSRDKQLAFPPSRGAARKPAARGAKR